ncbi:MAG TPA: glycogen/starch/alpha-glucan phosphorylase [Thermodesulfobacteriota bacterium]|nr:glycogen/starch/alpha-glucan phosphorylase [Thermodesulfobacteriota bacterium]
MPEKRKRSALKKSLNIREAVLLENQQKITADDFARTFLDHLFYTQGRTLELATINDLYMALAHTVRDQLLHRWLQTTVNLNQPDVRIVSYLSAEYLLGPQLESNLLSLGLYEEAQQAMQDLGLDLSELVVQEEEPGLGNGGLGRLAACYLDSLATREIPAAGYGIRYEFGIFDQEIRDGWQIETTDKWLRLGNPWEIPRPEISYRVKLGGRTEPYYDEHGCYRVRWLPAHEVMGIAYDTPIPGYEVSSCNTLRLWRAEAVESFDFQSFNAGDYEGAVTQKVFSETISKVLYPNDDQLQGKQLRLAQQYFFVSCSLQDMLSIHGRLGGSPQRFHEHISMQLNDTHPSVAVAELMRLLVDEYHLGWEPAWDITQNTFAYTNHTLLPEALEKWPVAMFGSVLPRHLEIIYEINRRFLDQVRIRYPGDTERVARLSLIDESGERFVRMANLAAVGSYAINGVARLHSELLKHTVLHDFYEFTPEKFTNVTNGVTPRRFLAVCNPGLCRLITSLIGSDWIRDLNQLKGLEKFIDDPDIQHAWRLIKHENKEVLATVIARRTGITVRPDTIFDVQAKRIHEYKRQHLNVLHIITLYNRIKQNPSLRFSPRTFIFAGKAAPGYFMAKLIIKLINAVGNVVNHDPDVAGRMKVVFLPDFNVKHAQTIYPAADLSEQISTAGKEASGTGNMKFALNGSLTIGTLDGANIEIREQVGTENFFLFGLSAEQVQNLKSQGYNPYQYYESDPELRAAIDCVRSGLFSDGDIRPFQPLVNSLLRDDPYLAMADYRSYVDAEDAVGRLYQDTAAWTRMSMLTVSRMGFFSSDRAIQEYCEKIWRVEAKPITENI